MKEATKVMRIGGRVLMMWLAVNTLTIASAQTAPPSPPAATVATPRDGQHDFDFEIGTWRTHLRRRLKPLTGSNEWIEMEGITTVRKVWNGRANLVELVADGARRHFEGLSLRLYHPEARQWSLHFSNAADGEMAVPTVGEFRNGRGEFYSQESYNGRTILVRFVISDIKADSVRFEQAFSDDYGKTWEVNWIATDTRVNGRDDEGPPAGGGYGSSRRRPPVVPLPLAWRMQRGYTLAAITLDPASPTPLHRQLYEAIRQAIVTKQLHAGSRLPSTRSLAADLEVSRNTVLLAFEQLLGEGYLDTRSGSGTFVANSVPDELLRTGTRRVIPAIRRPIVRRARKLPQTVMTTADKRRAFEPALPALDLFPIQLWTRLIAKQWSKHGPELLDSLAYGDAAGHVRLRTAIAQYVGAARGVACEAAQVIVTNGLQHSLEMICRALVEPGESIWFEDPAYPPARAALAATGAQVVLVPVDAEGIDVNAGLAKSPTPRLIYVTPSHQFPLGVTMSVARRLQLLDAARRSDAWIVEDDYDGEYRHRTAPVPAIHGMDSDGRVIYLGSFSKSLFPALRLGYVIVPPSVAETFLRARALAGRTLPAIDQLVVADFIELGHFERHIRRMRAAYRERQEALVESAAKYLAGLAVVEATDAGMHSLAWLEQIDAAAASREAAAENLEAAALSAFCGEVQLPDALVLGYGAVTPRQIRVATEALGRALERARRAK